MMKIGIIGNGKSANRYHLPFLLQRKDKIKVKTIVTNNLENIELFNLFSRKNTNLSIKDNWLFKEYKKKFCFWDSNK